MEHSCQQPLLPQLLKHAARPAVHQMSSGNGSCAGEQRWPAARSSVPQLQSSRGRRIADFSPDGMYMDSHLHPADMRVSLCSA